MDSGIPLAAPAQIYDAIRGGCGLCEGLPIAVYLLVTRSHWAPSITCGSKLPTVQAGIAARARTHFGSGEPVHSPANRSPPGQGTLLGVVSHGQFSAAHRGRCARCRAPGTSRPQSEDRAPVA